MNKPHTYATKRRNSSHPRKASPRDEGGRAADRVTPGVRLSARNPEINHTTGAVHFLRIVPALESGMAKRKKTADQAVACVLRVVTKDGRTVLEIEIPDERARIAVAALILRGWD